MRYTLGCIGAGNMCEAIVRGAIDKQVLKAESVIVADPSADRQSEFEKLGIAATNDNEAAVRDADHVLLAVKPQTLPEIAGVLGKLDAERQVVISIMAGVSTRKIEQTAGLALHVIRVMPNTPLMAGCGMSAICLGRHASDHDAELVHDLFAAAGEAVMLDERQMDAVTAVSGSGPAYLFYLAEAMADAAKKLELPETVADLLVRQTLLGAATLLSDSEHSAERLRRRVTSPGGTTQAATEHMDSKKVKAAITRAIEKAAARSKQLGG